ncbi:MAG: YjhG/YagF family D-xylonate dehydratase [Acidobacteriia bacterium]|nr:YjhG/YagF family D-xylonate dehydratase [Terriglobia bacterium]
MQGLFVADDASIFEIRTDSEGPAGTLPLTPEMLRTLPSGDIFGWTQDAGMGWNPAHLGRDEYLILSTQGGIRAQDGSPVALGYHTGHFEVGLLMHEAAVELRQRGAIPFAGFCSDPCDGRTQGTPGMMDSLPYRNDAAQVLRRLIRSLPTRSGVIGVATCDKGLPAMTMALASMQGLPCVLVPGGVTLPTRGAEDAGRVQTIGARFAHGELSLELAQEFGCKACGTPGGGCQFLGTAATAQVVAEALGLALPHTALAPSGQAVWKHAARKSAEAVMSQREAGIAVGDILTDGALRNAMVVHAAFGGSTNLLLHLPAVAYCAGLKRPGVDDWAEINRQVVRLVDVLPNGPVGHPTVRVFLAGGVPEVMLHLRALGLLDLSALTATGASLGAVLDEWEGSERRGIFRDRLRELDGVDPDEVIFSPDAAVRRGLTSTITFCRGNLAPEGSVVKSTAIDPAVIDSDGVYRKQGPAKVFIREADATQAIKDGAVQPGDVMVLACCGPLGSGMEEIYQITSALKHLSYGKEIAVITDARFSGVSTGACIGHVGPEALAGGPLGKLVAGDIVRIEIDCRRLRGSVDLVGHEGREFGASEGARVLSARQPRDDLAPHPEMPDDTRLWAALQACSGGTWNGCVYDVDAITAALGREARRAPEEPAPTGG